MLILLSARRMMMLKDVLRISNKTPIRVKKLLQKLNSFLKNPVYNASSSLNCQLTKLLK